MATIEEAIRAMLTNGTELSGAGVPSTRVTHGYRLQDSALPAVTFEITDSQAIDCARGHFSATVAVTGIAATTLEAVDLGAAIETAFDAGTFDTLKLVPVLTSTTVNPPSFGLGDEQEPATATVTATVYWS